MTTDPAQLKALRQELKNGIDEFAAEFVGNKKQIEPM
jgi:hypothetical protein